MAPQLPPPRKYWIDASCDQAAGGNFNKYIDEARHWAGRAAAKMTSPSDTDFARVFNVLFKTLVSDNVPFPPPMLFQRMNDFVPENYWKSLPAQVRRVLSDFANNWQRTTQRREADVRIYSDFGRRWRQLPSGEHIEPVNHVLNLCSDEEDENGDSEWSELWAGDAFVSHELPGGLLVPGEKHKRVLVSVFGPNVEKMKIDRIGQTLIARLIFHEMMHSVCYGLNDHDTDGMGTAGWQYCMKLNKGAGATGAESLAYFGLWAALADARPAGQPRGGFTMHRSWDKIPGDVDLVPEEEWDSDDYDEEEKEEAAAAAAAAAAKKVDAGKWNSKHKDNGAVRGEIKFYTNITK
ncbi:hypothetical protein B0T26DRAFT_642743 [Lasiosphaeria miniovina]|uniref:Uncharacterized protein n=1 Tax=Lasiosphaeria miniovina TaxID=1954250 RepID=A0AA40AWL7_9PEZI|nr:uncharacterized protein B0T26DRAFT_642743 [Lasiosphaeria miniovina]KAK0723338.1 hypothetical protein B0T26DRAFT_642743 [Lasiosphaeria miniovina]